MDPSIDAGSREHETREDEARDMESDAPLASLVRGYDWASTELGAPATWSTSLRTVVQLVLANRFPMLLWWGPNYIQIYNDAYAPILGSKHPEQALGRPFKECWHEVFDVLGPLVDVPFRGGPATWMEDIELVVRRHGFPEESHFTIAYSAVPDDDAPGGIGGVLGTVIEITQKVIGERRLRILSELGSRAAEAKTDREACHQAIDVLRQHPKDIPFAALYLHNEDSRCMTKAASSGLDDAPSWPADFSVDAPDGPLSKLICHAAQTGAMQMQEGVAAGGPWPDSSRPLAVVPIKSAVAGRPAGTLVAGISAGIRPDALYRSFLELAAGQIGSSISNARAYEEERRRAEALAQIDHAKTLFFSNVSHEFRTPLTLMLGPVADALADPALPEPLRSQLVIADRNAQRLLKLVNSLLDFARIEAGRAEATFAPVDLAALTSDLASSFRSAMERAGLSFEVVCHPLHEAVHVDRSMWEKLVLNLLSNAFKFTFTGGVRVELTQDASQAVLEVADTGTGIAASELPRLFDRFHRIEGAASRTHEGSGIGLALVQEIVRLHGGTIAVESTQGVGSKFRVSIPFGAAHLPAEHVQPSAATASESNLSRVFLDEALRWLPDLPGGEAMRPGAADDESTNSSVTRFGAAFGSRILLADDNADMRGYLRGLLERHYVVDAVPDGQAAMERAKVERPDLVLADVMMPVLDGFGLVERLRADDNLRDVPVILLSARAGEEARIEGLSAGADDYIVKPFYARELLTRVGSLLELARLRREGEARFRAYVQATNDAVYRMSADWSEMRQLQGRDFIADEAGPNRTWMQKYIHPDDQALVADAITRAIGTKTPFQLEHRVIRVDGSLGWTSSRAVPLLDEAGEITEWFGAATDITERRQTQEALQQQQRGLEAADRQKNEFLAMLAHELRNPLAPLRSASELLTRLLAEPSQAHRTVHIVERQVTHLSRLVDDLLDISRITQGRIELRRSSLALDRLMANSVESVEPLVRAKGQTVTVLPGPRPLTVFGDPERLIQCFGNVLSNASKFTGQAGEIQIRTQEEGDCAVVTISDNGVGIAPETLPQVFDLFAQGERTLDRTQGGLGIGLAVVKRLVEMHGGSVAARSEGPNRGSAIEIRLPLATGAPEAPSASVSPVASKQRILLVDDNRDAADMLAELLAYEGHQVTTAYSSDEALRLLSEVRPDVALLDIGLPNMDGYELARRIRTDSGVQPVRLIAITGYALEPDSERAQAARFAAHLMKPVEFSALQRLLVDRPESNTGQTSPGD